MGAAPGPASASTSVSASVPPPAPTAVPATVPTPAPPSRARARRVRAGAALLLALFLVAVVATLWGPGAADDARATVPGADEVELVWTTGNRVYYGNYNTPIFTCVDTDGEVSFAYCVDPSTTVPDPGFYETTSVEEFNPWWASQIRAAMWFGYGGPGFDRSMWPSAWNDGSSMHAAQYYAATHLILSYATTQNLGYVYYNAGSAFISYAAQTFLGIDLSGATVNAGSTMFQMFARAGEVPDDYTCYYLECGAWDYAQYVIAQDHYDPPDTTGGVALAKTSALPSVTEGNACYSLEGARFGVYADEACTRLAAELATDASGAAAAEGLEAGTYWVRETVAPPGYVLDGSTVEVAVAAGETASVSFADAPQTVPGPEVAVKADAESPLSPQGAATLRGTKFAVSFYPGAHTADDLPSVPARSWVFASDETGRARYSDECLVSGDELFRDAEGRAALPLGTYAVTEAEAPEGYVAGDGRTEVVCVAAAAAGGEDPSYAAPTFLNLVARGDVEGVKVEAGTSEPMAGVAFLVTSLTTGEAHVLVTDDRGAFSTASSHAPHTRDTNASDAALDGTGAVVDETALSSANGVWFSGSAENALEPDDARGALPYDTYRFDELPTAASYGHALVSFEATVSEDGATVDLGAVEDEPISLDTAVRVVASGLNVAMASEVAYAGLTPGARYELRAYLALRDGGELLFGGDPVAALPFTPETAAGSVENAFALDASGLVGTPVVVYERLYRDGLEVASHADPDDADQTLTFVSIGTEARGGSSLSHEEQAGPATVVVDEVSLAGLRAGEPYVLATTLVDAASGEAVVDAGGGVVYATTAFTASGPSETVEVGLLFDATGRAGTSVVVFESLLAGGVEVASHRDLGDAAQTVALVGISTEALDRGTGTHRGSATGVATVVDTVTYRGLTAGATYTLVGALVDPEGGGPVLDPDGDPVTAAVAFAPESADGAVEVAFTFDASGMKGRSAVATESLYRDGSLVAAHADLADEAQTVDWPVPAIPELGRGGVSPSEFVGAAGTLAVLAASAGALLTGRRRARP